MGRLRGDGQNAQLLLSGLPEGTQGVVHAHQGRLGHVRIGGGRLPLSERGPVVEQALDSEHLTVFPEGRLLVVHQVEHIRRVGRRHMRRVAPHLDEIAGRIEPDRKSTSELQSPWHLVCRLLLEKKKKVIATPIQTKKGFIDSTQTTENSVKM